MKIMLYLVDTGQTQSVKDWNKNNSSGRCDDKIGKKHDRVLRTICKNLAWDAE